MKTINKVLCLVFSTLLTSCTYSIILTDTHGTATDVVDSDPKNEVEADPNLNVPVKPL